MLRDQFLGSLYKTGQLVGWKVEVGPDEEGNIAAKVERDQEYQRVMEDAREAWTATRQRLDTAKQAQTKTDHTRFELTLSAYVTDPDTGIVVEETAVEPEQVEDLVYRGGFLTRIGKTGPR